MSSLSPGARYGTCATRFVKHLGQGSPARQLRSKFMITLCALALSVTAVPLFLLLYQLFDRGLPVILHTGFFNAVTSDAQSDHPRMPLVGSRMPSSGTLVLSLYASIMAIPSGSS